MFECIYRIHTIVPWENSKLTKENVQVIKIDKCIVYTMACKPRRIIFDVRDASLFILVMCLSSTSQKQDGWFHNRYLAAIRLVHPNYVHFHSNKHTIYCCMCMFCERSVRYIIYGTDWTYTASHCHIRSASSQKKALETFYFVATQHGSCI